MTVPLSLLKNSSPALQLSAFSELSVEVYTATCHIEIEIELFRDPSKDHLDFLTK